MHETNCRFCLTKITVHPNSLWLCETCYEKLQQLPFPVRARLSLKYWKEMRKERWEVLNQQQEEKNRQEILTENDKRVLAKLGCDALDELREALRILKEREE